MKKRILIGFVSNDKTESISIVTKAIMRGLKEEYDFIPLYANRKLGSTKRASFNVINAYYFFKHLLSWISSIVKYHPDVAHYPITSYWNMEKSLCFLFVAHILGVKTIGHLHGGKFIEFWSNIPPIRRRVALYVFKKIDGLIVLSHGWKEKVKDILNIRQEIIYVVNNQIDSEFERSALENNYSGQYDNILCLGVMDKEKGLLDILEAARMIQAMRHSSEIRFILAGPERMPNIYRQVTEYISNYNLSKRVILKKEVWGLDKIELFKESTILLLPSFAENFPLVVVEAAAFGIPIIATRVGATPEYFEEEVSALYVRENSPSDIIRTVLRLVDDKEKAKSLGLAARKVYQNYLSNEIAMGALRYAYERTSVDGKIVEY